MSGVLIVSIIVSTGIIVTIGIGVIESSDESFSVVMYVVITTDVYCTVPVPDLTFIMG